MRKQQEFHLHNNDDATKDDNGVRILDSLQSTNNPPIYTMPGYESAPSSCLAARRAFFAAVAAAAFAFFASAFAIYETTTVINKQH